MRKELTAQDIMQTDVRCVPQSMSVIELQQLLISEGLSGVPVLDGHTLTGIISRSDIIQHLSQDQATADVECDYYWELESTTFFSPGLDQHTSEQITFVDQRLANLAVSDLMVRDVISVAPSTPLREVARLMYGKHIHRVLVVKNAELKGVITTMDFTRLFANE
jgi:CBS domain-containing protein